MNKINGDKTEGEIQLVCKDCAFAIPQKSNIVGKFFAECRRFPPEMLLIQGHPVIAWPVLSDAETMFCFEFKSKVI